MRVGRHSLVPRTSLRTQGSNPVRWVSNAERLDCFVAAAERQSILSDAAGGVEGLLAMTKPMEESHGGQR